MKPVALAIMSFRIDYRITPISDESRGEFKAAGIGANLGRISDATRHSVMKMDVDNKCSRITLARFRTILDTIVGVCASFCHVSFAQLRVYCGFVRSSPNSTSKQLAVGR